MSIKTLHIIKIINFAIVIALFFIFSSSCSPTKKIGEEEYWLYKQNINIDNPNLKKKKIKKYFRQKTNKLLFGIAVPVFFYNSIDPEKERRRELERIPKDIKNNRRRISKGKEEKSKFYFSRWLLKIGEPLALFDDFENYKTKQNIEGYLKSKGYYHSTVSDSFEIINKKMWLTYVVATHEPYVIDSFYYEVENKEIEQILKNDSANYQIKKGVLFDSDLLKAERLRVTKLLKSKSYYLFRKEYIHYYADTSSLENKVQLKITILNPNNYDNRIVTNHKKFKINDIHIYLGYDPREELLLENDYLKTFEELKYNNIIFHFKGNSVLDPNVILRGLYIKGDSLYNFTDVEKTYQYLTNLHTFKLINIGFKNTTAGGFIRDTDKTFGKLDCIIKLTTTVKQSYSIEAETNISSYGDYGAAASIGYKNQNLWRKAIVLEINTKAAREWIYIEDTGLDPTSVDVNTLGGELNLLFPKFLSPRFLSPVNLDRFDTKYKPKTHLGISTDYQKRFEYNNLISTFSYGYKWKTNRNVSHSISLAELSTTKVFEINSDYKKEVLTNDISSSFFDNILLGTNYQYLFTNHKQSVFDDASFFRFGLELSGNILAGLTNFFDMDDVLDPYSTDTLSQETVKGVLGLPYFQFAKLDLEYRRYFLLNNEQQLVFRGFLGLGLPYSNMKTMPIQKQYYSGGANSIRAWGAKRLGPGSLFVDPNEIPSNPSITELARLFQNSDFKIEFNIEHRFKMFWKLDGAIFIDAGNIWSLSYEKSEEAALFRFNRFYKEIAVGSGLGIRLNFDFFVARIDLGVRVIDPAISGSKWAWKARDYIDMDGNLQNLNLTKTNLNLNFSIGYPF